MTTGDKIKRLRKERGWTQEELGDTIGVKKAAINKYETGIVVNLKRETIKALANAFDVNPVWLMDDSAGFPAVPSDKTFLEQAFTEYYREHGYPETDFTTPKTPEARIISGGIDKLPKEQRERALNMLKIMFEPQYANLFTKEETNDDDT